MLFLAWLFFCLSCSSGNIIYADVGEDLPLDGESSQDAELFDFGYDTANDAEPSADLADAGSDSGLCQPNNNGVLDFNEFYFDMGDISISIPYTVNRAGETAIVPSIAGVVQDGQIEWDFSEKDPDKDQLILDTPLSIQTKWFADRFPEEAFMLFDQILNLYSIYRYDLENKTLQMLGVASAEENKTAMVYADPIDLIRFPLRVNDQWSYEEVRYNGLYEGIEYPAIQINGAIIYFLHTFDIQADKAGILKTPAGAFPVFRLFVTMQTEARSLYLGFEVPVATADYFIYIYLAECFGLVARVKSLENETNPVFTQAMEYRRIGY